MHISKRKKWENPKYVEVGTKAMQVGIGHSFITLIKDK